MSRCVCCTATERVTWTPDMIREACGPVSAIEREGELCMEVEPESRDSFGAAAFMNLWSQGSGDPRHVRKEILLSC